MGRVKEWFQDKVDQVLDNYAQGRITREQAYAQIFNMTHDAEQTDELLERV